MKRRTVAIVTGLALAGLTGAGVAAAATGDGPGGRLSDILSGLVSKGTISQEQAEAVQDALEDARAQAWADREERMADRQADLEALFATIGLTPDEVRTKLRDGQTLREIAGDKADELAAAFKAQVKEHLAEEVADGRITQEQADERLADLDARTEAWLDGSGGRGMGMGMGMGPMGERRGGGMGHGGGGRGGFGPGAADDDATTSESSTAQSFLRA